MLVLLIGMLLLGQMHAIEPLVVLSSIHHVLLLETILVVDAEVVNHGSAWRSGWRGRVVRERTATLRRGRSVVVAIGVVRGIERPLVEPSFHNAETGVSESEFSASVSST